MAHVKIVVGSKTFKLEAATNFGDFLARLSKKVGPSPIDTHDISYVDDENQTISVACEEDFKMAFRGCTKKPLKFVLKSLADGEQNEDLFRVSTMSCFIGRVEAKMEALSQAGEISPISGVPLFGSFPSFQTPVQTEKSISTTGCSIEKAAAASVPNQQNRLTDSIVSLLNLMVLAKLKHYVLDQFKDICHSPAVNESKREHNATKSTIGVNLSQISHNKVLADAYQPPPDEPSNVFYAEQKKGRQNNLSCLGGLTRVGRFGGEQEPVDSGADHLLLGQHHHPQQQLHGRRRGPREKGQGPPQVLHQGAPEVQN